MMSRWAAAGLAGWLTATAAAADWSTAEHDGRVEAKRGESLLLAWQRQPLAKPAGGAKFAGSAFFHPLRTPAGFEWTSVQPADHLHHFGLWWPWKFIEVSGKRYNTWEIQEGQGGWQAGPVKTVAAGPDQLAWEFRNTVMIRPQGGAPVPAIHETAKVRLAMHGTDGVALDLALDQTVADAPVTIVEYRYSGFSWRGPLSWNTTNSRMLTSEGLDREQANGKPARWVFVSGTTPQGSATVLLMSAAATPECLRVWDSKAQNGNPFVNFNPVTTKPLPLDADHPAVSKRRYRVIAVDRTLDAKAAEAEWRAWLGK